MKKGHNLWLLLAMVTVFAILGNLVGEALSGLAPLLGRSISAGLNPPLVVDLGFVSVTFGFAFSLNLAGLIGLVLGAFLYRRWV